MHSLSRNILLSTAMHGLAAVSVLVVASAGRGVGVRVPSPSIPVILVSEASSAAQEKTFTPAPVRPVAPEAVRKMEAPRHIAAPVPPAAAAAPVQPLTGDPKTGEQVFAPSSRIGGMSITTGPPSGRSSGAAAASGSEGQTAPSVKMTASPGGGTARIDAISLIRAAIEKAKAYPAAARRRGIEGTAVAGFAISGNGRPVDIHIVKSSGSQILDAAAVQTVTAAAPFPVINGVIEVPLVYRLQK